MKSLTFTDVVLRLFLSCVTGAAFGFSRARKKRAAGLRTYILSTLGACLAMLMAEYEYQMMNTQWLPVVEAIGFKFDASRFGAQVISGIGFLGAGTIIASGHMQVSGLTTATGLFTSVCVGMAVGAGFYYGVIAVLIPVVFILDYSNKIEHSFKRHLRNMTLYVTFEDTENLSRITQVLDQSGVEIFDMDFDDVDVKSDRHLTSVVMSIRLSRENPSHSALMSDVAVLPCVVSVQEMIF